MPPAVPALRPAPRLRHRPSTRADIAECMGLLPAWLALDEPTRAQLPELWLRLVDEPSVQSSVTEDLARPAGSRILSWGVSMCLAPGLVAELGLDAAPEPYVVRRVYRALLDRRFQSMSDREMGQANAAADLRLLAMHFDMKGSDLNDPLMQSLMVMGAESFRVGLSGYNTRSIYYENSEFNEPWMLTTGFLHRPHAREAPQTAAPGDTMRYYRVTRDEALATTPGSTVRHIFEHHTPMFRLSASQRRLLWLSLFDDNDDALEQRLGVSMHGLKKLWRGIYERIQDQQPDFFGEASGDDDGKRGREKRRQVLAYVRQRPEELRPWATVAET
ncbi:MAG: hypothetical protein ABI433_03510 [Burkholderiaceae bacterium]